MVVRSCVKEVDLLLGLLDHLRTGKHAEAMNCA